MIPNGLEWNQAELEAADPLNRGLISLISFDRINRPTLIGTAFVVAATGRDAVACTAAHNLDAVRKLQSPRQVHHPSALAEFLPNAEVLDIDKRRLRALCFEEYGPEMATVEWAVWDRYSDVALFGIATQNHDTADYFSSAFLFDDVSLRTGDELAVLGYEGMQVLESDSAGDQASFTISRRLLLRAGRVTAICMEGYLLCRGPCIETTIPVFPGMSGGPAMLLGSSGAPIKPFGLISSDLESTEDKWNRSIPGHSTVVLLRPVLKVTGEHQQEAILEFSRAVTAGL